MNDSKLLPPVGVGPCLSPGVADHPLRPATRLSLGEPLPHQQADSGVPSLSAITSFSHFIMRRKATYGINPTFVGLFHTQGQVAHAVTHPFATFHKTEVMLLVRLACLNHAASVHSEPGSTLQRELCELTHRLESNDSIYNSKKYDR